MRAAERDLAAAHAERLPAVSVSEVKEMRHELQKAHESHEIPEQSQEVLHMTELEGAKP